MRKFCKIERIVNISSLYSFFIRTCDKDFHFHGEAHDFYEVVCVLHGSLSITAGTDVYTLSAGNAFIHPPMEFHALRATNNKTATALIFSFTADAFPVLKQKIFSFTATDETLLNDAWHIRQKAFVQNSIFTLSMQDGGEMYAQRVLENLSLFLLRILTQKTNTDALTPPTNAQAYTAITTYISENLPLLQSAPQIARANGISTVGLQKLFHKYTGSGVMHYINHLKIMRAVELLKNGSTNKETALALGFANQNYFSTVFKRITGVSPTQYLKRSTQV